MTTSTLSLALALGFLTQGVRAEVVVVDVSGTFSSDPADLFGNLPPATFPFPGLLGGSFSGSFSYDTDAVPSGIAVAYLSVDVDIYDNLGTLIHTIDEGPNSFKMFTGSADANLGQSFGIAAELTPEDLRLQFDGVFEFGVTPSKAVMGTATTGTGSFIEVDGTAPFTYWDLPVSSFTFDVPGCGPLLAVESTRFGFPPNPVAFLPGVTTGPVIGSTWDPMIDHAVFLPGAVSDFVLMTAGAANISVPPLGTLLCDPAITIGVVFSPAGVPFSVAFPSDCALVGVGLCTQGASLDGLGTTLLTNALDIVIGTY